jgi:hypothetical protein
MMEPAPSFFTLTTVEVRRQEVEKQRVRAARERTRNDRMGWILASREVGRNPKSGLEGEIGASSAASCLPISLAEERAI